jgi:hypothetical protein
MTQEPDGEGSGRWRVPGEEAPVPTEQFDAFLFDLDWVIY